MMKHILFIVVLFIFAAPSFAAAKQSGINSKDDGYNLPKYDSFNSKKIFQKNKMKSNAPALTIVNEPYKPAVSPNLNHMGQGKISAEPQSLLMDDMPPIDIAPSPVQASLKEGIVAAMPSPEPVTLYTPESLSIDEPPIPMPLTPEPLPVQEVASLDAAEPMPLEPITPQQSLPERARFYALAGTSLRESLRAWAGTQEFALVWDTPRDFTVKKTVSSNSGAELALRDILSMYVADEVRPIGKLYCDPRTSRPVLVVKSDK